MTVYVCSFPEPAPSLNEWRKWHWAKQERERMAFQTVVEAELNRKGNKCPRGFGRADIHAVIMLPGARRRDSDNFGAVLAKWTQDVLTGLGVIPDDTADRCTFHPVKIVAGQKSMTGLTIELEAT